MGDFSPSRMDQKIEAAFNMGWFYLKDLNDIIRSCSYYLQMQQYFMAHRSLGIAFDMISPFIKKIAEKEEILNKLNSVEQRIATDFFKVKMRQTPNFSPVVLQTEKDIREVLRILLDKMRIHKLLIPLASDPSRALMGGG